MTANSATNSALLKLYWGGGGTVSNYCQAVNFVSAYAALLELFSELSAIWQQCFNDDLPDPV